jgi:NAD(P)-dependent dehydrogenase (short-subunit alcohol dehydrogenase family)
VRARASAPLLAREGARTVLTDIRLEEAEREAAAIRVDGDETMALAHDVTDEAAWERVVADVLGRLGRLDVLVNCAGVGGRRGPPEEETLEGWRAPMAVNLDGVFLGTKHAVRAMKANRPAPGGSVVNLCSVMGLVATPVNGAYTAWKGRVRLDTKSTALHCAREGLGIRVNSVHPGYRCNASPRPHSASPASARPRSTAASRSPQTTRTSTRMRLGRSGPAWVGRARYQFSIAVSAPGRAQAAR